MEHILKYIMTLKDLVYYKFILVYALQSDSITIYDNNVPIIKSQ